MLEWTVWLNINVVSLFLGQDSEFSTHGWQMEGSDLLVELLWKFVNLTVGVFVAGSVLPQIDLGKSLVGE